MAAREEAVDVASEDVVLDFGNVDFAADEAVLCVNEAWCRDLNKPNREARPRPDGQILAVIKADYPPVFRLERLLLFPGVMPPL